MAKHTFYKRHIPPVSLLLRLASSLVTVVRQAGNLKKKNQYPDACKCFLAFNAVIGVRLFHKGNFQLRIIFTRFKEEPLVYLCSYNTMQPCCQLKASNTT